MPNSDHRREYMRNPMREKRAKERAEKSMPLPFQPTIKMSTYEDDSVPVDGKNKTNWWKVSLWVGICVSGILVFAIVKANNLADASYSSVPPEVELTGINRRRYERGEILKVLNEDFGIEPEEVEELDIYELVELGEELCAAEEEE